MINQKSSANARRPCGTADHRVRSQAASRFTLVELVVSMAVLVLVMLMLMQLIAASQKALRLSESRIRVFESSRAAFDILERDFRAMVTSTISDKEIAFVIADPDTSDLRVTLVAASDPIGEADVDSRLAEITYRFDGAGADDPYTLRRQSVFDDHADWDFTGRPAGWNVNESLSDPSAIQPFSHVISGVLDFQVTCYEEDDLGNEVVLPPGEYIETPIRIEVNMVLCDEQLVNAPPTRRFQTQRSFTKIFYLGDLQTN